MHQNHVLIWENQSTPKSRYKASRRKIQGTITFDYFPYSVYQNLHSNLLTRGYWISEHSSCLFSPAGRLYIKFYNSLYLSLSLSLCLSHSLLPVNLLNFFLFIHSIYFPLFPPLSLPFFLSLRPQQSGETFSQLCFFIFLPICWRSEEQSTGPRSRLQQEPTSLGNVYDGRYILLLRCIR